MTGTNTLIKPVENCFEEIKVKLSLQLPPMDTNSICSGTKSMLDRLVFKYKTELGGIIISYYDVIHTEKEAKIFYDSPYLGINIQVKFLVFKPFKDQILNGVVKRVSSTHISLLVFGTISASIPKSNIPKSFAFDHSSNMFMNKQTKATISVGTKIAFKVIDVSADRHNIGIQGDMTDLVSTGIIGFEEIQSQFSQYDTPNKANIKSNSSLANNIENNSNNITKFNDDSEKESEEEPKPITIVKEVPKIQVVSVKVESKKTVDIKKEKESKKRKKVSSSEDDSSSSDSSSSEDDKKKKKKKNSTKKDTKKSKKVESSDSSSSEEEKEKKKKKKK